MFLEKIFHYLNEAFSIIYTLIHKNRFSHFGKKSRINFGIKLVNPKNIYIGDNVVIGKNVFLNTDSKHDKVSLIILNHVFISRGVHINAYRNVKIEESNIIGENVFLGDTDHVYANKSVPIIEQGWKFIRDVTIKRGSHIGMNACIAPGISIGSNNIIAPNSYVMKNTNDYTISIGNPSRELPQSF